MKEEQIKQIMCHILDVDNRLEVLVNAVLHHKVFKKLERIWFELHNLLRYSVSNLTQCHIFPQSLKDFSEDLKEKNSRISYLMLESEMHQAGGRPFTALLCLYSINSLENEDLQNISGLMMYLLCPCFIDIRKKQRNSGELPPLPFLCWIEPEFRLRKPYINPKGRMSFFYESLRTPTDFLWGSGSALVSSYFLNLFEETGWFTQQLPFSSQDIVFMESVILETEVSNNKSVGISSLCQNKFLHELTLFSPVVRTEARGALLPLRHVLSSARIAHATKAFFRQKIGGLQSAEACEIQSRYFLQQYCAQLDKKQSPYAYRHYPLREFRVSCKMFRGTTMHIYLTCVINDLGLCPAINLYIEQEIKK